MEYHGRQLHKFLHHFCNTRCKKVPPWNEHVSQRFCCSKLVWNFKACYTMQHLVQYRLLHLKRFIHGMLHYKLHLLSDQSSKYDFLSKNNPWKMNKNRTFFTRVPIVFALIGPQSLHIPCDWFKNLVSLSCPVKETLILTHSYTFSGA